MQFDDSVEPEAAGPDWMRFKGTVLDGGYQLEDIIAADAQFAAFRVRVLGDASIDSVAHFYACDAAAAVDQAAVWQTLRHSPHRNLNTPLGAGQVELDGHVAAYIVVKRANERLSGVLEQRALRPAEAGEVLTSISSALAALHARGLVHGCISPEHVLATDDAILLSTESIRRADAAPAIVAAKPKYVAPEMEGPNTTAEADIWCLGATLFQALTRKECGSGCREEGARLALPFGRIVQRCLEKDPQIRGKLPEITELYTAGMSAQPKPETTRAERPKPAQTARPRAARAWPAWAYGAIAVLIAIFAISLVRTRHRPAPTVESVSASHRDPGSQGRQTTKSDTVPQHASTAWPTRTLGPEGHNTAPSARETQRARAEIWRVVLYTYNRPQDAEAKARQLNQQHPGLQAEAFSPGRSGSRYLVVAGGQMDRSAAARLRAQVLRMGLPRDAYIQNFRR